MSIEELESQLPQIRKAGRRVDAFDCFATIEKALEPIEECVNYLEGLLDAEIQLQIDIARGK